MTVISVVSGFLLVHGMTLVLVGATTFSTLHLDELRLQQQLHPVSSFMELSIEQGECLPCPAAWLTISEASSASIKSHIKPPDYVHDSIFLPSIVVSEVLVDSFTSCFNNALLPLPIPIPIRAFPFVCHWSSSASRDQIRICNPSVIP